MSRHFRLDFTVFIAALALYWLSLAPGVLPADAGEFQVVAARLGVAHPPGYPLYTLLGRFFIMLMPHDPARAVNFLSAVVAALTVMLVGRSVRRASSDVWAGVAAAAVLAFSSSFWVTAGQASIRPMTAFFVALALDRLIAYGCTRRPAALFGFGLAVGLGGTHHPSVAFPAAFFGLYLLSLHRIDRRWLPLLGGVVLGFLPWLYLPLRGPGAFLAPGGIATWQGFWDHVLARGFTGDLFAFTSLPDLLDRGRVWVTIMRWQFNPLLLLVMSGGGVLAFLKDWRLAFSLWGGALLHSAITMTYRAPQTVEYLIPAYVLLVVVMGVGVAHLRQFRRLIYGLALALVVAGSVGLGVRNAPSIRVLAEDASSEIFAENLLRDAPPEAVILAPWHHATALWAVQYFEGTRADVEVVYVFPQGSTPLADTWVTRTREYSDTRPVIVTGYYPVEFEATAYTFTPLGTPHFPAWAVHDTPLGEVPAGFDPLSVALGEGQLTLVGIDAPQHITPGQQVAVRMAWAVDTTAAAPLTGFVHLTTPEGIVITASDVRLGQPQAGDVVITRHIVGLPPESTLPELGLIAGAYRADGPLLTVDGQPRAGVGSMARSGDTYTPHGIPFDGMSLADVRVSSPEAITPGQSLTVDLTFHAARPLLTDRIIKVDVVGEGYSWRAQSDHVPASGAIPTLKWLAGWQVHDRHRLTIPPGVDVSGARLELVIYDQFTNQPYPVLDPTLNQQGVAVTLHQWP